MAHALALDTLQYAKRLQKAGFTEVQVEVQVEIIKEQSKALSDLIDDSLVTKQDIKELDLKIETRVYELKRDIKELDLKIENTKSELIASIAKISYRNLISLGTMITVATAILGFLIKVH